MTQPELSRLLQEVGAVPAPAADYGATVRASVARARLVRTGVLAGAALLLGGAALGTAVALSGGNGPDTVAQTAPTPSATPTPTEEPTPTPTPTPREPTPTPTPVATTPAPVATTPAPLVTQPPRTAAPVQTTTRPVTRRPTPRQTTKKPTPAPTYAAKGASVSISYRVLSSETHRVEVTVTVRDNDGYLLSGTLDWDDGSAPEQIGAGSTTCGGGGTAAQPSTTTKRFTRTYPSGAEGKRVVATVTTGSSCRSTPRETRSATVFVNA